MSELRKFKLIDREGYRNNYFSNSNNIFDYLEDGCFSGVVNSCNELISSEDAILIGNNEFKFFEEVFPTFPQIGDRATYGGNKNCEVVGVHNNTCMLLAERGDYHLADIIDVSEYKPLTEDEIIIRSKIKNLIQRYTLETALDYLMEEYTVIEKE